MKKKRLCPELFSDEMVLYDVKIANRQKNIVKTKMKNNRFLAPLLQHVINLS